MLCNQRNVGNFKEPINPKENKHKIKEEGLIRLICIREKMQEEDPVDNWRRKHIKYLEMSLGKGVHGPYKENWNAFFGRWKERSNKGWMRWQTIVVGCQFM